MNEKASFYEIIPYYDPETLVKLLGAGQEEVYQGADRNLIDFIRLIIKGVLFPEFLSTYAPLISDRNDRRLMWQAFQAGDHPKQSAFEMAIINKLKEIEGFVELIGLYVVQPYLDKLAVEDFEDVDTDDDGISQKDMEQRFHEVWQNVAELHEEICIYISEVFPGAIEYCQT
ncbi:MAG: hypothetical protein UR28_C0009G0002 [Candidatus Peregrinibacteria bacterium GW2011_GWF2_33_10]|nr:MAG: hypothetical protein UR28_C0009G0002 [Candidatus Peregrinibacteria bacterium GW2011_GWF2_33_10]OGJ44721.1 MAG: hypothetical protein A2263_02025 [Candidatus Peregrinibacteria bacterium RIFOXYA2_FULL_33_21]OGJ46760.1 MAG: hypothetical protein A2272_02255 [Candidatus Peregrinibacteria bacterium RIFOXYA12_FULL_33_12]OGJ50587.1 MAG: hypothetical protein A2307_00010 [Candidatus Peregrinibacteria bacterium RIFOXYB2_FULL_33_20]